MSASPGSGTRFHHPDRLGTNIVTDQSNGELVTRQMGLPYGTQQPGGAFGGDNSWQHPDKNNPSKKRFTSYDRSDATGLDYAVNRHYSSAQGRFTQVDPIGMEAVSLDDPQTLNLYSYCANDPINYVDPDGLFFKKLWRGIKKFFSNIFVKIAVVVALAVISAGLLGPLTFQPVLGTMSLGGGATATIVGATQLTALGWTAVGLAALSGVSLPSWFGKLGGFTTPPINGSGIGGASSFLQTRDSFFRGGGFSGVDGDSLIHVFALVRDRLSRPRCARHLGGVRNALRLLDRSGWANAHTINPNYRGADWRTAQLARRDSQSSSPRGYAWTRVGANTTYLTRMFWTESLIDRAQTVIHELKHQSGVIGHPPNDSRSFDRKIRLDCGLLGGGEPY